MKDITGFSLKYAEQILDWVKTPEQLMNWASIKEFPCTDITIFRKWHSDPEIEPYIYFKNSELVGYGEIWFDSSDKTVELGRVIINSELRNCGFGSSFVKELIKKINLKEFNNIDIRIHPGNIGAIKCYEKIGFKRISENIEEKYNQGQANRYLWYSYL